MPRRASISKKRERLAEIVFRVVAHATGQLEHTSPPAEPLRPRTVRPSGRKAIAKKAAAARWKGRRARA